MYSLFWRSPALPFTQKQIPISVPAGSVVSTSSSLRFTGKGASNYGKIQQENQLRLLENFAGPTEPPYATVGQTWYDTSAGALKVCISTAPQQVQWRSMNSTQITEVGEDAPSPASLGDSWFSRTGSQSGIQYVYTGLGRYPERAFNAVTSGVWPAANTTTLAVKLNYQTFTTPNFGEVYIHGYTGVTAADVAGSILVNGVSTPVTPGVLFGKMPSVNAYIVWDTTSTMVSSAVGSGPFFQCRQLPDARWQYDDNESWIDFTPVLGMHAIGLVSVSEIDDQTAPGVTAGSTFVSAIPMIEASGVPAAAATGTIGGWAQTWPETDLVCSRHEYDFMLGLLLQLIGEEVGPGGSGALGRSIQFMTNFLTLDATLRGTWKAGSPLDQNVFASTISANLNGLSMQPNSQDWDLLLGAARYAVNRLELPPNMFTDLSPVPFVQDGRPAPLVLNSFSVGDVRRTPEERIAATRYGTISLSRLYQETANVLQAAIMNRYLLKGMLGTSGTNTTFASNVSVHPHANFSATMAQFTTLKTHTLNFNFDDSSTNLNRFFTAGQALEVIVAHPFTATVADTDLKTLCDTYGRLRLTADAAYVMSGAGAVASQPTQGGALGLSTVGTTLLASFSQGGATLAYLGQLVNGTDTVAVQITIQITTAAGATGNVTTQWNWIGDDETFMNPGVTRVYPAPNAYVSADKGGTATFS